VNAAKRVVIPVPRHRPWLVAVALVIAAASAAGSAAYLFWWPEELCRRWEARVAAADDGGLPTAVAGLDRCGRYAVRPLVNLLSASRPAAADAAETALATRIRRIRSGDGEAWRDAAELGEALQAALGSAPVESQPRHVRLAMELLEASGRLGIDQSTDAAARGRVIAACETVLRNAPPGVEPARFVETHASPLKTASRFRSPVRQVISESAPPEPTGPIGPQLVPPQPLPTAMPASPVSVSPATALPRNAANAAARVNPIRNHESGVVQTIAEQPSGQMAGDGASADGRPDVPAAHLASRTAWSLFNDLTGDGPASSLAGAELHRRGFRPAEIELGRQFAGAAPDQRLRLAESLPLQSGIDIRPWLVHLADDDDPSVRLAVVTIMATTNDPQMLARLRQIALADSDEAVRQTARKLTDTGRGPGR